MWRSLVQPDFRQFDLTWLAHYAWVPILLGWFTIVTECGYGVAMWIPRLRFFWLAAIISLHVGIALFLGLGLFGLIMILLSISAFSYEILSDLTNWFPARFRRFGQEKKLLDCASAVQTNTS